MMNSTLKALATLACLVALPAAALNHEDVVAPLPPGKFPVACSNVEIDTGRLAQLGGNPADYYEGHPDAAGNQRYITDILAHRDTAFVYSERVPLKPQLYPTAMFTRPEFAVLICHPTSRSNTDPNYQLPANGGTVPHMQRAGQAPKLISTGEYYSILGTELDPPPPQPMQLPLIVYSHGLGGSPVGSGYIDVAVQLAAQGFMVAAVFHADNRFSLVKIENLGDFAFAVAFFPMVVQMQAMRPFALKAMTDNLLGDGGYGAGIDRSRIGAFGASLGGEAVAHLVGARLTTSIFKSCDDTEQDSRIRAAVGYVPYSGHSFLPAFCDGQSGAASVNKPYLAIAGTLDITAPISQTERAVNLMGSSRYLVELVNGEHELRPQDAGDVITWMVTYFNAYLDVQADPGAMGRFIRMGSVTGGRSDSLVVDVHKPFASVAGEAEAREFYNTILGHYFVAAGQGEIDGILQGAAGPGWELTGESFKVWPQMPADTTTLAGPVCRFYGGLSGGPNSHFFTASPDECQVVKNGGGWFYEGIGFYIRPVAANPRQCPFGLLSVNRAYNNGFVRNDSNHRFTTSDSSILEMERKGWTVEGTVMCARP